MNLQALYLPDGFPIAGPPPPTGGPFRPNLRSDLAPALFSLECRECAALALLVIAERTTGVQAIVLHELVGGISSPHSPDSVRYFLDQAHRSRTMGALSAALAMYRAALEHLLLDQGFEQRMLGPKIQALEAAVGGGTAPPWARDLDPAYLTLIKDLGNASLHSNEGSVKSHEELDTSLVWQVDGLFLEILDAAYERPARSRTRLEEGQRRARELQGRSETTT